MQTRNSIRVCPILKHSWNSALQIHAKHHIQLSISASRLSGPKYALDLQPSSLALDIYVYPLTC